MTHKTKTVEEQLAIAKQTINDITELQDIMLYLKVQINLI